MVLRTAQAALYLGVAPGTLDAWRRRGVGPAYLHFPSVPLRNHRRWESKKHGLIGYPVDGLDEFIRRCEVQAGRLPRPHPGRLPGGKNRRGASGK